MRRTAKAIRAIGVVTILSAALHAGCASTPAPPPAATHATTVAGPPAGTLVIVGGGRVGNEIMDRFIALAGGRDARIVIMPGAGTEETFPADWGGARAFRDAGVQSVTVLHTRSREEANSDRFASRLREATGVWIPGGRQWRLADTFLGTRTLRELHALLARGGVIGGTSAGASIQASYMVRGAVEGNTIVMAPGHEEGFGFLRDVAIDQHLTARNRQEDLLQVVGRHPTLLGIGIDENTALIVRGDRAEVIGNGRVAFYNTRDARSLRYYFLEAGDVFDLAGRRTLHGRQIDPDEVRDEQAVLRTMNRLFEAMRQRDTAAIRALTHPELRLYVPQQPGDARPLRVSRIDDFIASIAAAQQRLDERPYDPLVRVDGPLAAVWTYYEFWRGDTFSHCGTDALHFARTGEASWQIISLAYTVQREGCRQIPRS